MFIKCFFNNFDILIFKIKKKIDFFLYIFSTKWRSVTNQKGRKGSIKFRE